MNPFRKALYAALGPQLRDAGYQRRAACWYRHEAETIRLVNLDKSPYGQQFYVNLAVALKALGCDAFPPEHHCHVRFRLDDFVPDPTRLEAILDFDDVQDESLITAQALEVAHLIERYGLPWLATLGTESGIRAFLSTPLSRRGWVSKAVRERLNVPEPS